LCCGLYAASLYKLDNLQKTCSARLQDKLKEDCGNALLVLQLNERFNWCDDNVDLFDQVCKIARKNERKTERRLQPSSWFAKVFQKHNKKNSEVPFCTESRVKKEDEGASNQVIYLKYMTK